MRGEPRAVYQYVRGLTGMVEGGSRGDVREAGAAEDDASGGTLTLQPGEVDGGVDADACEACCAGDARAE